VIWNLFADLLEEDPAERSDQIFEIASTVFSEDLANAAQNMFFAAAARDVFAGVVDALARQPGHGITRPCEPSSKPATRNCGNSCVSTRTWPGQPVT